MYVGGIRRRPDALSRKRGDMVGGVQTAGTSKNGGHGLGEGRVRASKAPPQAGHQTIPRGAADHGAKPEAAVGVKTFVLDTNILLYNPDAIFVFQENNVVLPFTVIEELDAMKRKDDDLGRNARACIRHLDRLREIGPLSEGVDWGELPSPPQSARSVGPGGKTGTVRIDVNDYTRPPAISENIADNRIIAVAWHLKEQG